MVKGCMVLRASREIWLQKKKSERLRATRECVEVGTLTPLLPPHPQTYTHGKQPFFRLHSGGQRVR